MNFFSGKGFLDGLIMGFIFLDGNYDFPWLNSLMFLDELDFGIFSLLGMSLIEPILIGADIKEWFTWGSFPCGGNLRSRPIVKHL